VGRYLTAVAPIFLLLGCASDWTEKDTKRQLFVSAVIVADAITTARIADSPGVYENGPIAKHALGPQPEGSDVALYFGAVLVGNYVIATLLPERWRRHWQYWEIGVHGIAVYRNCQAGLC
jgi:hypothetical protein